MSGQLWKGSALVLALAIFSIPAPAQESDDLIDTFRKGRLLLYEGNDVAALAQFQAISSQDLTQSTAYDIYRSAHPSSWQKIMAKGGDFADFARHMIALASLGRAEKEDQADTIQALIEKFRAGNFAERKAAIGALSGNHGEYAVPYLLPHLGAEGHTEFRYDVIQALGQFSSSVVPAITACMESEDVILRRSAILILSMINDPRAIPQLKMAAESEEDSIAKQLASQNLPKIAAWTADHSAHDLFCMLGEGYQKRDAAIIGRTGLSNRIWQINAKGQLEHQAVPTEIYFDELARQAFAKALAMNPDSDRARSGLVLVLGAQKDALAKMALDGSSESFAITSELSLATLGVSNFEAVPAAAVKTGGDIVAAPAVLQGSTEGNNPLVAASSIDKRVRYAAAISMAANGTGSQEIVPILADAVGEKIVRIVHLIDQDQDRRNQIHKGLTAAGFLVVPAATGPEGLAFLKRYGAADAIVIGSEVGEITLAQLLAEIMNDERLAGLPRMILAAEEDGVEADLAAKATQILTGTTEETLAAIAEATAAQQNTERTTAQNLIREAAIALSLLDASALDLTPAGANLLQAVMSGDEEIALSAARALIGAGTPAQVADLVHLVRNQEASKDLRLTAAAALGGIFSRMEVAPSNCIQALHETMLKDADMDLRRAAAAAIGRAANLAAENKIAILANISLLGANEATGAEME